MLFPREYSVHSLKSPSNDPSPSQCRHAEARRQIKLPTYGQNYFVFFVHSAPSLQKPPLKLPGDDCECSRHLPQNHLMPNHIGWLKFPVYSSFASANLDDLFEEQKKDYA